MGGKPSKQATEYDAKIAEYEKELAQMQNVDAVQQQNLEILEMELRLQQIDAMDNELDDDAVASPTSGEPKVRDTLADNDEEVVIEEDEVEELEAELQELEREMSVQEHEASIPELGSENISTPTRSKGVVNDGDASAKLKKQAWTFDLDDGAQNMEGVHHEEVSPMDS